MTPMPPGDSASAASAKDPAIVAANKTQNSTRRPVMEFPARAICVGCDGRRFNTRLRLLIPGGPCKFGNITREAAPIVQSGIENTVVTSRTDELAQALWYIAPGQAEMRQETLAPLGQGEARVRALLWRAQPGHRSAGICRPRAGERISAHARAADGRRFSVPGQIRLRHGRRDRGRPAAICAAAASSRFIRIKACSISAAKLAVVRARRCSAATRGARRQHGDRAQRRLGCGVGPADRVAIVGAGVVGALVAFLCGKIPGDRGHARRYQSGARGISGEARCSLCEAGSGEG